jgi:hypothetical protein
MKGVRPGCVLLLHDGRGIEADPTHITRSCRHSRRSSASCVTENFARDAVVAHPSDGTAVVTSAKARYLATLAISAAVLTAVFWRVDHGA